MPTQTAAEHVPFIMYALQAITGLLITIVLFLLKKLDTKMDTFQTKEICTLHHDAHENLHSLEKENIMGQVKGVRHDLNNGLTSIRSLIGSK